jgi:hypothetical protein
MLIECQLVAIFGDNPNERNIREIALEKPKFENGDVDQFFKKNEASFTENKVKPTDPPEFLNTTSQQINPRLDHETKNDSPINILSSPPLEVSPPLTHQRVQEISNTTSEKINPHLDNKTKNNSRTTIISYHPFEISRHLTPRKVQEILNTTSEKTNPCLDHETENDSPTTTLSSPLLEISPPLTQRKVQEIVKIINGSATK